MQLGKIPCSETQGARPPLCTPKSSPSRKQGVFRGGKLVETGEQGHPDTHMHQDLMNISVKALLKAVQNI